MNSGSRRALYWSRVRPRSPAKWATLWVMSPLWAQPPRGRVRLGPRPRTSVFDPKQDAPTLSLHKSGFFLALPPMKRVDAVVGPSLPVLALQPQGALASPRNYIFSTLLKCGLGHTLGNADE